MFCKNCGSAFQVDNAAFCVNCGCQKGAGNSFCYQCGNPMNPGASVCLSCGCSNDSAEALPEGSKSKMVAGLLGIFLGQLGIHNFYLGYSNKAIIQLAVTVGCYIISGIGGWSFLRLGPSAMAVWGLIEGIQILTGKIATDAQGRKLKDN